MRPPSSQGRFLLHAHDSLDEHVPDLACPLGVDDGDIRHDGGHGRKLFPGVGTFNGSDARIDHGQIRATVAAEESERQRARARLVSMSHGGVAVLLDFQLPRPAVLHCIAQPCREPTPGLPQEKTSFWAQPTPSIPRSVR